MDAPIENVERCTWVGIMGYMGTHHRAHDVPQGALLVKIPYYGLLVSLKCSYSMGINTVFLAFPK